MFSDDVCTCPDHRDAGAAASVLAADAASTTSDAAQAAASLEQMMRCGHPVPVRRGGTAR